MNLRELLSNNVTGNSDEVEFIINFAETVKAKNNVSDEEILRKCLVYLAGRSNWEERKRVSALNEQISKGIRELTLLGKVPNLRAIARHAIEASIEVVDNLGSKANKRDLEGQQADVIKLAVVNAGYSQYEQLFKAEFLAQHKWDSK